VLGVERKCGEEVVGKLRLGRRSSWVGSVKSWRRY